MRLTVQEYVARATEKKAEDMLHPYWNMAYHEGQINYIQTLEEQRRC